MKRLAEPDEASTDLVADAACEIAGALRLLLADVIVLYVKTKNFHWHMSGSCVLPIEYARNTAISHPLA